MQINEQINTTKPIIDNPEVQIPTLKNSSNTKYLVSLVIFLFLILTFFVYKYFKLKTLVERMSLSTSTDIPLVSSPSPAPIPNTTIITTNTDQNTFQNQKIGIELSYPGDWFTNDDYPRIYISKQKLTENDMSTLTHGLPGSFQIFVTDDEERISSYEKGYGPYLDVNGKEYASLENIKINGKDAIRVVQFAEADMASVGGYTTTVSFLNNNLLISFSYPNQYNDSFDHEIYEEILSSVKFVD